MTAEKQLGESKHRSKRTGMSPIVSIYSRTGQPLTSRWNIGELQP